jgi:preprotein translocase subunit SecE
MATKTAAEEAQPNVVNRVVGFYQDVRSEMDKVTWPTVDDLKVSTQVTLYLLGVMAVIAFALDQGFQWAALLLLRSAT